MKIYENVTAQPLTVGAIYNENKGKFAKTLQHYDDMTDGNKCVIMGFDDDMNVFTNGPSNMTETCDIILISDDVSDCVREEAIKRCRKTCTNVAYLKDDKWHVLDFSKAVEEAYEKGGIDAVQLLCIENHALKKLASYFLVCERPDITGDMCHCEPTDTEGSCYDFIMPVNGRPVDAHNCIYSSWSDARCAVEHYL